MLLVVTFASVRSVSARIFNLLTHLGCSLEIKLEYRRFSHICYGIDDHSWTWFVRLNLESWHESHCFIASIDIFYLPLRYLFCFRRG